MSYQFRVYANGGTGGPVDYATPVATVTSPTYTPAALAPSTDWTFAVRVFDPGTGLEEKNVAALLRIVLDASGNDVTNRPPAPRGLSATAQAGGKVRVRWTYDRDPGGPRLSDPQGWHVYLGTPTPNYATPAATIPYFFGRRRYATGPGEAAADPGGLADGAAYQVAVRAYNARGEEQNAVVFPVVGSTTGPSAVDSPAATAVP